MSAAALAASAARLAAAGSLPERAQAVYDFWFGVNRPWPPPAGTTDEQQLRQAYCSGAGPELYKIWFGGGEALDRQIAELFKADLEQTEADGGKELRRWAALPDPRASLAAVVMVDQFPRNIFRNTARAFSFDALAVELAKAALRRPDIADVRPVERIFLLLPLEHSEQMADHEQLHVELDALDALITEAGQSLPENPAKGQLQGTRKYADEHTAVLRRFGRYPHRNKYLGRQSTPEEEAYLQNEAKGWAK